MHQAELFVALLVAVVLTALAARRLERVPDAVALVVAGIVAGLLPFAPDLRLDPNLIFVVFLPPILYPSAFTFAFEDVRSNLRPISALAVGRVLVTIAAVAAVAHAVGGIAWSPSFVLGAVLAPTDPVAATAVIRASGAPGRLATILEGESLINDGTALTALKIAIAAVGGAFSLGGSVLQFAEIAAGGAAVGAGLGWLTSRLRRRLDDLELESAITVLLAYSAYLLAERVGASGVLAVVFAGFVMGRSEDISTPGTRVGAESFWAVIQFLGESILFLLVGLAFAHQVGHLPARGVTHVAATTAAVVAVAIAIRLAWMWAVPPVVGLLDRRLSGRHARMRVAERTVLAVAGLRGALSVAAALSIPLAVDGTAVPERDTVVTVAIASIVILLVLPAVVLPAILGMLGLRGSEDTWQVERRVRAALAQAALEATDGAAGNDGVSERALHRARERYELRLRRYSGGSRDDGADDQRRADDYRRVRQRAVTAQRRRLAEMRRDGEVHGELLRDLERELDVEELRIA